MPAYEIEQYELHVMKHRVEATSEADAIAKLLADDEEPVCGSPQYAETAEDYGLPADEHRELADALRKLGIPVGEVIPSIGSIRMCPADTDRPPAEEEQASDAYLWRNYYRCPDCNLEWQDEWDCQCNDRCPGCNKEIEPYNSEPVAGD